jgi:N4-(beta-N-acetylglucosaminyl)-L-asparaginase
MQRRKFLSIGSSVLAALPLAAFKKTEELAAKPIVISTWDAGINANKAAWAILANKGKAIDAVEQGVKVTEAEINCCVGLGANPDREGFVTLDACIMDEKGNCGSVAFLEDIKHPISVARKVMENTPHVFLVGEGAQKFALSEGFSLEKKELSKGAKAAYENWLKKSQYKPAINRENNNHYNNPPMPVVNEFNHDTIAMIALDSDGNLSASCTTSGQGFKMRGRIGDSPIIGAGLFVDNEIGAAAATGQGEDIVRIVGSHLVVELMRQGFSPNQACKNAIERLIKLKGVEKCKSIQVGFIAINKKGQTGAYSLQKGFTYATCSSSQNNSLKKSDFIL